MRKRIANFMATRPAHAWRRARARHLVALVDALPAPAFLVEQSGKLVCANHEAALLVRALANEEGAALRSLIAAGSAGTSSSGCIVLSDDAPLGRQERAFSLQIAPVADLAFVTAREITFERNTIDALARSRAFYRDLVACACDFAWATDENGVFTFVSEDGAAGYTANALHGRPIETLEITDQACRSVFSARNVIRNAKVALRDAHDRAREFSVSAYPVTDAQGNWRGAHGTAIDISPVKAAPVRLVGAEAAPEAAQC